MFRSRLQQLLMVRLARPIGAPSPILYHCLRRTAVLQQPPARALTTSPLRREAHQAPLPSTYDATPVEAQPPPPAPQPTTPNHQPRWRRRGLIYATTFFCVGAILGTAFRFAIVPPAPPLPGSPEDQYLVQAIQQRAMRLPLVETLAADPAWTSWNAYSEIPAPAWASRLTTGPMAGARGLAYQKVFHNRATGELVSVVHFGPGTSGWPGLVHGGALATVLDESLGRCAIMRFPANTGVTARLELDYKAPSATNDFYVIRVVPVIKEGDNVVGADGSRKSDRKMWVKGHVEDLKGKVRVTARALFVVPKSMALKPLSDRF